MGCFGIHQIAISQRILKIFIIEMSLKFINLRQQSNAPGANELMLHARSGSFAIIRSILFETHCAKHPGCLWHFILLSKNALQQFTRDTRPSFMLAISTTKQEPIHKRLWARDPNLRKICIALSWKIIIRSGYNFEHVMTDWVSWHVQNSNLIGPSKYKKQHDFHKTVIIANK